MIFSSSELRSGNFLKRFFLKFITTIAHRSNANNVNNNDKGTTLSKHIWKLKEEKKGFNVSWRFVDRGSTYNPISRVVGPVSSSYTISFFIETCQHSKREMKYSICVDISDLLMTS